MNVEGTLPLWKNYLLASVACVVFLGISALLEAKAGIWLSVLLAGTYAIAAALLWVYQKVA